MPNVLHSAYLSKTLYETIAQVEYLNKVSIVFRVYIYLRGHTLHVVEYLNKVSIVFKEYIYLRGYTLHVVEYLNKVSIVLQYTSKRRVIPFILFPI